MAIGTQCVDRKINMTPLPCEQRENSVREAYEHLEPGGTMQAIDDFQPEWVRGFLQEQLNVTLRDEDFRIEESAVRYVVYVRKPQENEHVGTGGTAAESDDVRARRRSPASGFAIHDRKEGRT